MTGIYHHVRLLFLFIANFFHSKEVFVKLLVLYFTEVLFNSQKAALDAVFLLML